MSCQTYELTLASDDPAEQEAARRHAAGCRHCAALLDADRELKQQTEQWKRNNPQPPAALEARIAAALGEQAATTGGEPPVPFPRRSSNRTWWRWAAAAVVLLAAGLPVSLLLRPATDPVARAVQELDRLQRQQVAAIATLERQAEQVLARAADPELPSRQASLLLSYRDRLTHLDAVIAEVQVFLDTQPGHAGARKVLLAAYLEKGELLQSILHSQPGGSS